MNGRSLSHQDEQAQAIDREIDDFFAAGARLTKAFIRWFASRDDQGNQAGAVEIAPAQSGEPLMTVEDLASYLKIKPQTLRDWAKKGRIPYEPINSEIRFRRSVIDRWIDENRINKSSPPQTDTVVKFDRSILRPQRSRRQSNGRV
jgi:excisionase family DNA binding protein